MKARSVGTFVQIGGMLINMALVEEIEILSDTTHLHYRNKLNSNDVPVVLVGDEHLAFLDWWEAQAELSVPPPYNLTLIDEPTGWCASSVAT